MVFVFGFLFVFVNNVGIVIGGVIEDFLLEDWCKQNVVNFDGVFMGIREVICIMKGIGGGFIINVFFVVGLRGLVGFGGYCVLKGGVCFFMKVVVVECVRVGYQICVNFVYFGIIDMLIW